MAKGVTTNAVTINRSNYVLRANSLKRHEKNGTLIQDLERGIPGARRRFSNTKRNWTPAKDGKEPEVYG